MKWWLAIGGFFVGMLVSPETGVALAVVGFVVGLIAELWKDAPKDDPQPAADPGSTGELVVLRRELKQLSARMRTLEQEVARLKARPPADEAGALAAETAEPSAPEAQPERVMAYSYTLSVRPFRLSLRPMSSMRSAVELSRRGVEGAQPLAPDLEAETTAADALTAQDLPLARAEKSPPPTPAQAAVPRPSSPPPPPPRPLAERLPAPVRDLIFGGNTLVKVGVLLLFLGLAFLLRYAAERVTVPVPLRYAGVAGVGVMLLAVGWWLRDRRASYALILQGAGIGVFYLTTLAAMKLHPLIGPGAGFAFLLAVAVLSGSLAVLQNAMALALVAAIEGFAAPVLVSTGSSSAAGLFTYLTVLNLGIFGMAWFRAWRPLHLVGLAGTITLASGWAQANYTPDQYAVTQGFLALFTVLFSGIGLLFARRSLLNESDPVQAQATLIQRAGQTLQRVGRVDSALVFGAPLSAFGLQYLLVKGMPLGPSLAALAFGPFHLLLARLALAQRNPGLSLLAEAHVIVAVLFGTLAIPLGLEGRWTGAAWAVEAAGMYWLGQRQDRPYARVFALVVLGGAGWKLLGEMSLDGRPGLPWLQGSTLGPILLAASAVVVWWLHQRLVPSEAQQKVEPSALEGVERAGMAALPWLAAGSINLLPWLWLQPILAPAASAAWALAVFAMSQRRALPTLGPVAATLHGVAVLGLLGALQPAGALPGAAAVDAVLADGWLALGSSVFMACCLIATAWLAARPTWLAAWASGTPPAWTLAQHAGLVAGAALLHLAVLFVAPWSTVAWVWPPLALLTLWAALRGVLTPMALLAGGVQLVALLLEIALRLNLLDQPAVTSAVLARPFLNPTFLTTLTQALALLASAALLHSVARRTAAAAQGNRMLEPLAWAAAGPWRWGPLATGLCWWLLAWSTDLFDSLSLWHADAMKAAALAGLLLATGVLMRGAARVRRWPEMGAASLAVLPALMGLSVIDGYDSPAPWLPSHDGGWWAWPAALAWHAWALRRWPAEWPGHRFEAFFHTAGLWFFTLPAAQELSARLAFHSEPRSAWAMLGGVAVVAAVLYGLSRPAVLQRWPVSAQMKAYLEWGATPLAVWMLGWLWLANTVSAGDAAPLPVIPLLNPLELGLGMVLVALLLWQRALPSGSPVRLGERATWGLLGATGLALLTGTVLRACHHAAGVPWDAEALFASTLAQAAISISWTLSGVVTMVLGNRRGSRVAWGAGAALLGVVVLKLFFVELADHGGLYRIVSFIGVGALLLLVGYFAPVPARAAADQATRESSQGARS